MADLFSTVKPKFRPLSLAQRAGVDYPHRGYQRRGRDPRLAEFLTVLTESLAGDEDDILLQTLCAGVWWLTRPQAEAMAGELRRLLECA